MSSRKHSTEQIIGKLGEAEVELAKGRSGPFVLALRRALRADTRWQAPPLQRSVQTGPAESGGAGECRRVRITFSSAPPSGATPAGAP